MSVQPQLPLAAPLPTMWGACVFWNGPPSERGYCPYRGARDYAEPACDHAFGKQELNRPLYGGKRPPIARPTGQLFGKTGVVIVDELDA